MDNLSSLKSVPSGSPNGLNVKNLQRQKIESLDCDKVPRAEKCPIFGLNDLFELDENERKVNLIIGIYREENEVFAYPSIRVAEESIVKRNHSLDYLPISGDSEFVEEALMLLYGNGDGFLDRNFNRICGIQTIGGTGALNLAFRFLKKFVAHENDSVFVSDPTYANHEGILNESGFSVSEYPYYNREKNNLMFKEMCSLLESLKPCSIVLMQPVGHNPTGIDPSKEEWREILKIFEKKKHVAVFDMVYQGVASGNLDEDAFAVRLFARSAVSVLVCQSFSKNFGIYGLRTGCLSVLARTENGKQNVASQLEYIATNSYGVPPCFGASLVKCVLKDRALKKSWEKELKYVNGKIFELRNKLYEKLLSFEKDFVSDGAKSSKWSHVREQKGYFCYTGLSPGQVRRLREEWHVYLTGEGRLCVATLNDCDVNYVAEALSAISNCSKC